MSDEVDPFARDSNGRTELFHVAERGDITEVNRIIFGLAGTGLCCQRLSLIGIKDLSGLGQ